MSIRPDAKSLDERQDERLEQLADVSEELKLVANSDAEYAQYAENFLESLREAGYDV